MIGYYWFTTSRIWPPPIQEFGQWPPIGRLWRRSQLRPVARHQVLSMCSKCALPGEAAVAQKDSPMVQLLITKPHHSRQLLNSVRNHTDVGMNSNVPPGTPPAIIPGCEMHAFKRLVCSIGSIGTEALSPISRIFDRMDCRCDVSARGDGQFQ